MLVLGSLSGFLPHKLESVVSFTLPAGHIITGGGGGRAAKRRWLQGEGDSVYSMATTSGGFGGENAAARCTAMSKRSRVRCKGPAIAGDPTGKCYFHGGGNRPVGVQVTTFVHGRYSKYLPAELDRLYNEALSNPNLLEMADHIALLEARMGQILSAASTGDPVPRWCDVAELFAEVETAILSGDMDKAVPALEAFHAVLDAGIKWDSTWSQITGLMEQLRKMADTEIKRKKELHQMVPVERVVALMAAVGMAVKRHVKDPEQIAAVYRELAVLHGADHAPGDKKIKKVGPEVIDIGPERRGLRGGRSDKALARKAHRRMEEARALGEDV